MTFYEAAKKLKIDSYPEEFDLLWESLKSGERKSPLTRDLIVHLEERFSFFRQHYDNVLLGFDELSSDPARFAWTHTACAYAEHCSREEMVKLKLPETDGTLAGNLAPYFVLLIRAEEAFDEYLRRGFPQDEVKGYFETYHRGLGILYNKTGKPGIDQTYFNWVNIFTYTEIFNAGGFNFQFSKVQKSAYVLQHKNSHEVCILLSDITFHKDGVPLGTAGFAEEEGKFLVSFEETENEYIGFPVRDLRCRNEKEIFSKSEWKLVLKPADQIFALHIPRGADLSPEKVYEAIRSAKEIAKKRFPEYCIKGVRCSSWLLSAQLEEMLGENSSIVNFARLFERYPIKDNGKGLFGFVFSGKPENLADLPENTSLQRKVKERYLAGGYVYNYGGFIIEK